MTFDQYSIKENLSKKEDEVAQKAWEACKQEVLKILKTKDNFIGSGITTAIKEVEKI